MVSESSLQTQFMLNFNHRQRIVVLKKASWSQVPYFIPKKYLQLFGVPLSESTTVAVEMADGNLTRNEFGESNGMQF
ncbi:hypothetical protein SRHO_G00024620 [Serrasalmus rhombeus]